MTEYKREVEPILIGKRDAAHALGVCVRTLENLIAGKNLPARKIGRRTLIPYRALLEFARRDHPTSGEVRHGQ